MSSVESSVNSDLGLVRVTGSVGGKKWPDITTKELVLGESLLNPGLMVSITFQSLVYGDFNKVYMDLKNTDLSLDLYDGHNNRMSVREMKIYRMDNRSMMPVNMGRTEEFTVHATHFTLLEDAKHVMSKKWTCATPDSIVRDALQCVGATGMNDVAPAQPARDYMAEHIHPFQVIQQQCNVALDGNDPSFVHYMTFGTGSGGAYIWRPTHHFKSLRSMKSAGVSKTFTFRPGEVNINYNNPQNRDKVMIFEFPCMFDYLTDLLNGVNESGVNINGLLTYNPTSVDVGQFISGLGNAMTGGCIPVANMKQSVTNKGSSKQDYGCPTDVESHLLTRQARMALLDRDKTALRLTLPWTPDVHAGDKIQFSWYDNDFSLMPDSGEFIVASLTHKILLGGFSTTTIDCIRTIF